MAFVRLRVAGHGVAGIIGFIFRNLGLRPGQPRCPTDPELRLAPTDDRFSIRLCRRPDCTFATWQRKRGAHQPGCYLGVLADGQIEGRSCNRLCAVAAPLVRRYGVRVLSVAPGAIKTPINRSVWSDPQSLQDLLEKIPLGRIGGPEEVARMVVLLVSDIASYITGRTIFVDGGMTDYPDFAHGG